MEPTGRRFIGYPQAREGPRTATSATIEDSNPVLRGWPLVVAANIVPRVPFLARTMWATAQFGLIKYVPGLEQYDWRLEPVVTPLAAENVTPGDLLEVSSEKFPRQPDGLAGRFYSAADYHELYKSGSLTPLQVARAVMQLASGKYKSAWSETLADRVLAAATASTERYRLGKPLSVIDGVPIGVKEDTDVEGYTCFYGQRPDPSDPAFVPSTKTSWTVTQLISAGAVVVGTLAMHELGLDINGCNPRRGTPKNWNNTSYYPGGSSSGAASALTAGLIPFAVGTDAGGSIRVPCSLCGMFGLKPTLHRVQTMKTAITVTGPLAATAADLTIAYRLMTAPNPDDPIQSRFAPSIPPSPSAKKVIGICHEWNDAAVPAVRDATRKAIAYFAENLDYELVDVSIPLRIEGQRAHSAYALSEAVLNLESRLGDRAFSTINHANRMLLSVGACTGAPDFIRYAQMRCLLMEHMAYLWKTYPGLLLVSPTTPQAGWKIHPGDEAYGCVDSDMTVKMMSYIWLANSIGCPAVSAPAGFVEPEQGEGKLPVGLMAMGEWGAEEQLLSFAREAEGYLNNALPGGRVRPKEWADVVKLAGEI